MSFDIPLLGEWNHYAATWTSATGEARMYLNGKLVGQIVNADTIPTGIEIGLGGVLIIGQVYFTRINSHVIANS